LKKELGVITAQLQSKLSRDVLLVVDSKIAKRVGQREYYLMEQLTGKGIKKELGMESDGLGKDKLIENLKFKERAASASVARARSFKLKMPEGV
jgi:ATP-dependent Lon protease